MVSSFNFWMGCALKDMQRLPTPKTPGARRIIVEMVMSSVRHALTQANKLGDAARKGLCLRLLNWLRADLRRLA